MSSKSRIGGDLTKSLLISALGGMGLIGYAPGVSAHECANSTETHCWAYPDYGRHYSQVATGVNGQGVGIACAVEVVSQSQWGGNLRCFGNGTDPGAYVQLAVGGQTIDPSLFSDTDPTKRIISVAFSPTTDSVNRPSDIVIHVLRSDGQSFYRESAWPNLVVPQIPFSPDTATPPGARSLVTGSHSAGDNLFSLVDNQNQWWVGSPEPSSFTEFHSNIIMVAGALGGSAIDNLFLTGTTGTTTHVTTEAGTPLSNLPASLTGSATDPNASFFNLGVATPLAVGKGPTNENAWAVIPGTCVYRNEPCLEHATRPLNGSTWSSWSSFHTESMYDPNVDPSYPMPRSIQDGYAMHQREGEILAIAGHNHLRAWIP